MGRPTKLTAEEIADMKLLREEKHLPYKELAKIFSVDVTTVYYHLKPGFKEKRDKISRDWQKKNKERITAQRKEYMREYRKRDTL